MKKVLFLSILIIGLISCTKNPTEKAINLIKEELRETLHDYNSYESVKIGELDSIFTSAENDPIGRDYIMKIEDYIEQAKKAKNELDFNKDWLFSDIGKRDYKIALDKFNTCRDSMNYYMAKYEEIENNWIPEFCGFSMTHSFRANNASGNRVIGHYKYYFDKDITKIINVKDIGDSKN
ncbi:MAG: hypothetical protein LBQ22_05720 [Bacteroidales bacterium]|jgi:hypothetical protein|nr:hypothetical protein [Bacteroidales bacterium]